MTVAATVFTIPNSKSSPILVESKTLYNTGGFYVIEEQVFYYLLWKPTDNPQQFPPSRFMRVLALFFTFLNFLFFLIHILYIKFFNLAWCKIFYFRSNLAFNHFFKISSWFSLNQSIISSLVLKFNGIRLSSKI